MPWQHWLIAPWLAPLVLLVLLAGCATPPSTPIEIRTEQTAWSGRLSLQVEEQIGQAAQSFSAAFELQGDAAPHYTDAIDRVDKCIDLALEDVA